MNKKIFKRGVALAMLLVLTVSVFIVPTSAKEVTKTEEVQKNGDGYYISINDMIDLYGENSIISVTYRYDEQEANDNGSNVNVIVRSEQIGRFNETRIDSYTPSSPIEYYNHFILPLSSGDEDYTDSAIMYEAYFGVKDYQLYVTYTVEVESESLIKTMFSGFGETINGLTDGIKSMFVNILYVDGTSASGLSAFAKFGFLMGGLTMALGLGYVIINKLR